MGQRTNAPLLVLVLMALGISLRPAAETPQDARPSTATPRAAGSAAAAKAAEGKRQNQTPPTPLDAVRAYLGTPSEKPVVGAKDQFRLLLVTVPDPSNSRYAYIFDLFSESIQRAATVSTKRVTASTRGAAVSVQRPASAEENGYIFDRFWLPWDPPDQPQPSSEPEQLERWTARKERRNQPGLMLFRSPEPQHPLLVFLVDELPTSGLNKIAFQRALEYIRTLNGGDLPDPIRIAGPSFSGSIPSLKLAIAEARRQSKRAPAFEVVSGSATNASNAAEMNMDGVTYHAVIENDNLSSERFLGYLKDHGVERDRVAILSEAGTAFGQHFGQGQTTPALVFGPLNLTFPMNIARLRNAYQEDPELRALWSGQKANVPRQGLEFKLKETGAVPDQVPAFSTDQTPVSQEITISNLAVTIRREHILAVNVVATDILDAVFVAKLIQQECPDVRLFFIDSDLLYQHSSSTLSFYGTLLVTTYPLFDIDQLWQPLPGDSPQLVSLRSQAAQGLYNACRFLLQHDESKRNLLEYSDPLLRQAKTPPLWLTAVGREGFWPIRVLSNAEEPYSSLEPSQAPGGGHARLPRASRLWYFLLCLLTGIYLWHFVHVGYLLLRRQQARTFPVYIELPDPERWRREVYAYLLMGEVAMLLAYLPLVSAQYFYGAWAADPGLLNRLTETVLDVVCGMILGFAGWWILRLRAFAGWFWGLLALAAAAGIVAAYGLGWLEIANPGKPDRTTNLFFTLRSIFPASGVCPVLPMALVVSAISIWPFMRLQRMRFDEVRFPDHAAIEQHDARLIGLAKCIGDIQRYINQFPLDGGVFSWLVLGLLVAGFELCAVYLGVHGLESETFDTLFGAAAQVVYLLVVLELIRMLCVWWKLRGVLERLEWHPIRRVFRRLGREHPELSYHSIWQRGSQKLGATVLVCSADRLRRLSPWLGGPEAQQVEVGVQHLLLSESEGIRENAAQVALLRAALNRVAAQAVERILLRIWLGQVRAPDPENAALVERVRAAEDLVALRFVALIRYVTVQLRNILDFVSSAFLLLLLAMTIYPFHPHRTLMVAISILFAAAAFTVLLVFYQMDKDPILSRLSGTAPGKVSSHFFISALSHGALPLVTLLATQFGQVGRFLLTVFDPVLRAVH